MITLSLESCAHGDDPCRFTVGSPRPARPPPAQQNRESVGVPHRQRRRGGRTGALASVRHVPIGYCCVVVAGGGICCCICCCCACGAASSASTVARVLKSGAFVNCSSVTATSRRAG